MATETLGEVRLDDDSARHVLSPDLPENLIPQGLPRLRGVSVTLATCVWSGDTI